MSRAVGTEATVKDSGSGNDQRIAAFCSPGLPGIFQAIMLQSEIWKADPFDVETIHEEARATFQRLVTRASLGSNEQSGRILVLLGEAGSGKTHLMRAFRNWTHAGARGYFGYMQMTSATDNYPQYVLNALIESLDHLFMESMGETTGLMRLSRAIAESPKAIGADRVDQLRGDLDSECLAKLVEALADQVVMDGRYNNIDIDLLRALLYLQSGDPRIKSRVLKYLRCEDLSPADRKVLGDLVPRTYGGAPTRLIVCLGELMAAVEGVSLVLCVDQLEDIFSHDQAAVRFRRVVATLCDLANKLPSAVVIISCLEDFYEQIISQITQPLRDRITINPPPIRLKGPREKNEIVSLVSQRLRYLYESMDIETGEANPTFPFPEAYLGELAGLPTRKVLSNCHVYREQCVANRRLVEQELSPVDPAQLPTLVPIDQLWNDHRSTFLAEVPDEERALADLLARSIRSCTDELPPGQRVEVRPEKRDIEVDSWFEGKPSDRFLLAVCEKSAQGGALGKQIKKAEEHAGDRRIVLARSTEFPSGPKTKIANQIGELIAKGGKRVVIENSDWRAMLAFKTFEEQHRADPAFASWRKESKPLLGLKSLGAILSLDPLSPPPTPTPEVPEPTQPVPSSEKVETPTKIPTATDSPPSVAMDSHASSSLNDPIVLGRTSDRLEQPFQIDARDLSRHAAFLGGTGSGKTTLALNLIEHLLMRGIPAILIDRKGDLCGYARQEAWERPHHDAQLEGQRTEFRSRLDVAVYTPGNPHGRPLSISVVPKGLNEMSESERETLARYSAAALAGMMNYKERQGDQARQAILAGAIDQLGLLSYDKAVTLPDLIELIDEKDRALVNAVGKLDIKNFDKLVQDLETLRLSRGGFFSEEGEPLAAESLLGLGKDEKSGKVRLSIVSTKFLGNNQDVQFWVSQFLMEIGRWVNRSPRGTLQAVVLFDEADLYLPAVGKPATKEPMEHLLKRARSAGLGILLASQSPGDFDYKCRDNIRSWFIGRIKEPVALSKMKPMLSEYRIDPSDKLAAQAPGQFHFAAEHSLAAFRADRCIVAPEQLADDEIVAIARQTLERSD